MSIFYKRFPTQRYPLVIPLHGENYVQSCYRLKLMVDHWRRCDYVKQAVDDGPPSFFYNVRHKLKKLLTEGERLAFVERDNRLLLKRLTQVMRGPGTIDHFWKRNLARHTTTLNYTHRKQFITRVNSENKDMLKRILNTKTCYDRIKMELEYRHRNRSRRNCGWYFKRWEQLANQRRAFIVMGKFLPEDYTTYDLDEARKQLFERHKDCFPLPYCNEVHPLPLPRSSVCPREASPVDHGPCFTPAPILPPISSSYRKAKSPATGRIPLIPVHENRTTRLRLQLIHKDIGDPRTERFDKPIRPPFPSPTGDPGEHENVNQSARESFPRFTPSPPGKTSPDERRSTLDKLTSMGQVPSAIFLKTVYGKESKLKTQKHPIHMETKLKTKLEPLPPRQKGDVDELGKKVKERPSSSDSDCKPPSSTTSALSVDSGKKAGKGKKKSRSGRHTQPHLKKSSDDVPAPVVDSTSSSANDDGKMSELSSPSRSVSDTTSQSKISSTTASPIPTRRTSRKKLSKKLKAKGRALEHETTTADDTSLEDRPESRTSDMSSSTVSSTESLSEDSDSSPGGRHSVENDGSITEDSVDLPVLR